MTRLAPGNQVCYNSGFLIFRGKNCHCLSHILIVFFVKNEKYNYAENEAVTQMLYPKTGTVSAFEQWPIIFTLRL